VEEKTMGSYINGVDRQQQILFPESIEEYIEGENPVRLFDGFVDRLDMSSCGFNRAEPAQEGRPGYDPRDMLKL
jgi:transposase